MKRAVILTAVSSERQAAGEAASLKAQRTELETLAQARGCTVIDVIEIPGISRNVYSWEEFKELALSLNSDAPLRMERHWQACDFDEVLVWDGSRFGRKESIFTQFVLRTIDAGAIIVMKHGGELNRDNYSTGMLFGAYAASQEIRIKRQRQIVGNEGRFQRGLHAGTLPMTHKIVRDADGKPTGEYVLDERLTSVWRDTAALLIEGVAWEALEKELFSRFGHVNPRTGKPFGIMTLHNMILLVPMFWGHLTRVGAEADKVHPRRTSHWLYDESVPVPAHVQLKRDVFPAVWTGETRRLVVAELIRRRDTIRGRASATDTHMFSGLCACGECGYTMRTIPIYKNSRKPQNGYTLYLHCRSSTRHGNCQNTAYVPYKRVQAYADELLQALLEAVNFDTILTPAFDTGAATGLEAEFAALSTRLDTLITEQSSAPAIAQPRYRQQIETVSRRMEAIQRELDSLHSARQRNTREYNQRVTAIDELRAVALPIFWQQPTRRINQVLKMVLGNLRIVVLNKEILGLR